MFRKLSAFIVLVLSAFTVIAQNNTAAQFFSTPAVYNPAMTGFIAEDIRASLNYGQSWNSIALAPYRSLHSGVDMPLLRGVLPTGDALGVGVLNHLQSYGYGTSQSTSTISAAYHKGLGKKKRQHLSLGVQGAFDVYTYSLPGATTLFEEKHSKSYGSINAGIQYAASLSDRIDLYLGYAQNNIGGTNMTFGSSSIDRVSASNMLNFGGHIELSSKVSLFANAMYFYQDPSHMFTAGGYGRFSFNTPWLHKPLRTALYVGGWASRNMLTPYLGLEVRRCRVGVSYNRYLPNGGMTSSSEFSFIYSGLFHKIAPGAQPNKWRVPTLN